MTYICLSNLSHVCYEKGHCFIICCYVWLCHTGGTVAHHNQLEIVEVEKHEETHSYDVHYLVCCERAQRLIVSVEEEYGARMELNVFDNPTKVESVATGIASLHHVWIDFIVENQYGHTIETVTFGPGGSVIESTIPSAIKQVATSAVEYIKIYDINGICVAVKQKDEPIGDICSGVYVLKFFDRYGNCIKTCKYLKR